MKKLFLITWLLLPAVADAYSLFSGSLTNIFGTNGTATFTATGSTVAGSSNLLSVALDGTNYIFNSVPTTGAGWRSDIRWHQHELLGAIHQR